MTATATAARAEPKRINPGRNLPAAITVGLTLLTLVATTMLFFPTAFMVVVGLFGTVGAWEVNRALTRREFDIPVVPTGLASMGMPVLAYMFGAEALMLSALAVLGLLTVWTVLEQPRRMAYSVLAGVFTVLWVPFFLSAAMLLFREPAGELILLMMVLLVVANDTFGYIFGVLFGKHPMAPKISPKKSWEGFTGSVLGASAVGIGAMLLFDEPWWMGIAFGIAIAVTATAGDFSQSMVKRELQIKDFSQLLPGHGGMMDRLDSVVFAAPATYGTYLILKFVADFGI
ncbi:phosphatidate cytidylyltransferase [Micrococcoides hystricis]|uniref:Phosphatidate cytidylyltransferase n=1 Tax=Micrococcoides hystricis TaxID=1572761 RepID=A0ABV6P8Q8_9MICC